MEEFSEANYIIANANTLVHPNDDNLKWVKTSMICRIKIVGFL